MKKTLSLLTVLFSVTAFGQNISFLPFEGSDEFIPLPEGETNRIQLEMTGWFPSEECQCTEDSPILPQLFTTDSMKIWIEEREYSIVAERGVMNPKDNAGDPVDAYGREIGPDNDNNGWEGLRVPWYPHFMNAQTPDWREILQLSFHPEDYRRPIGGRLFRIQWKIWASIWRGTESAKQLTESGEVPIEVPLPDLTVSWKPTDTGLDVFYIGDGATHTIGVNATNIGGPLWNANNIGFTLFNRYADDMNKERKDNYLLEKPLSESFDDNDGVLEFMESIGGQIPINPVHADGKTRHFDSPKYYIVDPEDKILESREDNNKYTHGFNGPNELYVQQIEPKLSGFKYPFLFTESELTNNVISSTLNELREYQGLPSRFHGGVDVRTSGHEDAFVMSSGFGNYGYIMSASNNPNESTDKAVIIGDFLYGHIETEITDLGDIWGLKYFDYRETHPEWFPWLNEGNYISRITESNNPHIHFSELDHDFQGNPDETRKHLLNPINHFSHHTANIDGGVVLTTQFKDAYFVEVGSGNPDLTEELRLHVYNVGDGPQNTVIKLLPPGQYEFILELRDRYNEWGKMGVYSIQTELFRYIETYPLFESIATYEQVADYWLFNEPGQPNPEIHKVFYRRNGIPYLRYKITTSYQRVGDGYSISATPPALLQEGAYDFFITVEVTHGEDQLILQIPFAISANN